MTKEEVLHLGNLARIKLSDSEVEKFQQEIGDIIKYVSAIDGVVKDGALEKKVGPVFNVFRDDEVTNEPESFTEDLLAEMPHKDGRYLRVKKILNQDN